MCCLYLTMSDTASHLCFFKAQWGHPSGNFCFSQSGGPHPNLFGTRDQFCEDNFSTDPDRVWFWDDSSTWRRQWHPTPVLLPGKSHGRRSLVGCSPWGRYKSDMTERLHFHFSLSHIGEGNGNPLQCSCLENPRDGGAWLVAVYGVAQSQTRLKRLSSKHMTFIVYFLSFCFIFSWRIIALQYCWLLPYNNMSQP